MAEFLASNSFYRKKKPPWKYEKHNNKPHGKISSHEMQCVKPDHNMCQIDEVPTNLQTKEIATEVPIRMNVVLPDCHVLLCRLTEEEINQSYPDEFGNEEISNNYVNETQHLRRADVDCYNEHNYSQSADLDKEYRKKRLRDLSKPQSDFFEKYKQKRKRFIDRRNGIALDSDYVVTHSDESETDMSQDEFKSPSSQGKGKKKIKRGKYERDSEWNPHVSTTNNISYGQRLRKQARRPMIIDSDSSTTDEEEMLYKLYTAGELSCDSNSTNSAFQNAVPSDFESNEPVASSASLVRVGKDSSDGNKVIDPIKFQNSSQDAFVEKSLPDASHSLDIVAGIIKEMDKCKRVTGSLKTSSPSTSNTVPVKNNIKPRMQRGRKRAKSFDDNDRNLNSIVNNVLQEIVSTVCIQLKQQNQDNRKNFRKCIWCNTQFSTCKIGETMCNICYDQGKGKYLTSSTNKSKQSKDKVPKGQKQTSGSKIKKVSTTMTRVLKHLPKNEMQRLMYTEKNSKLSNEKGYSHCKSLSSPKDTEELADNLEKPQETGSGSKTNQGKKKITKKFIPIAKKSDNNSKHSSNDNVESDSVSQNGANSNNNKSDSENIKKRSKISLKKFNEGLFLMSFPDPDEELNINLKKENSLKSETVKQTDAENSKLLNSSRAAKLSDKSVSPPKKPKNFQTLAENVDYMTYLLPPICTVLIANYAGDCGCFCLEQLFYQNRYTVQRADTDPGKIHHDSSNVPGLPSCTISKENSSPIVLNTSASTIATVPLNNGINQMQPFVSNSPLVVDASVPNTIVTIMPVINLSEQPRQENELPTFPADKFVNSEHIQIKITSVTSGSTIESNSNGNSESVINCKNVDDRKSSLSSESSKTFKSSDEIFPEINATIPPNKTSTKRKCSNALQSLASKNKKKVKKQKENHSSDTDISDHEHSEEVLMNENITRNIKAVNIGQKINKNIVNKPDENIPNIRKTSETVLKFVERKSEELKRSENKSADQISDTNWEAGEASNNSAQKQSVKPAEAEESTTSQDPINSAIDLMGAVAVLGVIDLERNPPYRLSYQMEIAKQNLAKLTNENNGTSEMKEKIALCRYNLKVFEIAQKYLNLYGSFTKVSEYLMRRQQIEHKIQIKKERMDEDEDEEDTNQSSCRFSQRPQSATQLSNETLSNTPEMPSPSPLTVKMESVSGSCTLSEQASSALSHLERLQSQIAAMNNAQANFDSPPNGSTVHHFAAEQYAAYTPALAAPAPVTPRNDCMGGESRETPSRGSGPRTPARPESATSQPDEQSLALQVKREQFEAAVSSPSQCAYSQNTTLTQISSQVPIMQDAPIMSTGQTILNNALQQISVSGTVNQVYNSNQSSYNLQTRDVSISRAPPAYNNNKQNYTNLLLNIVPKPQSQSANSAPVINTNIDQNGQLLFGQQLYIPSGTGLPQKQAVPSVNNNQYIVQQPFPAPNNGGTVLVNNSQVAGQNVNALLTNVSNQQFYTNTSNQVPQLYYPPTSQIACTQSTMPAPNVTVSQNQGACFPFKQRNFVVRRICRFRDDRNITRNIYLLNFPKKAPL